MIAIAAFMVLAASDADDCQELYRTLSYREAAAVCEQAARTSSAERLTETYKTLGLALAAIGDETRARAAFVSLLALDPRASLPEGISPALEGPFLAAKAAGAGAPIALAVQATQASRVGRPLVLRVVLDDGSARPVTAVQIDAPFRASVKQQRGSAAVELGAPPKPGPVHVIISALDTFGGRLASAGVTVDVAPVHDPRPMLLSWRLWGLGGLSIAAASTAVGTYALWRGADARAQPYAADAAAGSSAARATAYAADVGWALTAAMAAIAALLLVTEPAAD